MHRHGTITHIDNQGTIVQLWMRTDDGQIGVVNLDHRLFWHMVRVRGAHRLIRLGATHAVTDSNSALYFDDD
jgi:hypothetical protein